MCLMGVLPRWLRHHSTRWAHDGRRRGQRHGHAYCSPALETWLRVALLQAPGSVRLAGGGGPQAECAQHATALTAYADCSQRKSGQRAPAATLVGDGHAVIAARRVEAARLDWRQPMAGCSARWPQLRARMRASGAVAAQRACLPRSSQGLERMA